ncbi:WLM domain-containing protein [Sphaerosporella brunnea]|uniref:WLM domain-containing protein n=1 Tax=Sphaerosporella brunnea TaxID=1250544 RepID=A0A5J5EX99_9PEZI|nr:WLM domain-containing protein [Sphaerosporella brunnea]
MPLGIERINVRRRSPNALINFITPLEGPTKEIAQDYLERIAAIVYPIMKENGLAIMSLDEFPPNTEFWGRNFNAGECIQIVLRHPHTGLWLPFKFVQGVMIHELAHNKQMNHSRAFWSVRNDLARILDSLHARNYTGEGFWSAGRTLLSDAYTQDRPLAEADMPKHICGGTYRARTRTRHRRAKVPAEKLSHAEQKKRRIERKFGVAGEGKSLAAESDGGGDSKPKPRVAQSKRGRELRVAAALARLEKQKVEVEEEIDVETASDTEDDEKTVNVGGGKFLVPVSGETDGKEENDNMDRELMELIGGACGKDSEKSPGGNHGPSKEAERNLSPHEIINLSDISETDSDTASKASRRSPTTKISKATTLKLIDAGERSTSQPESHLSVVRLRPSTGLPGKPPSSLSQPPPPPPPPPPQSKHARLAQGPSNISQALTVLTRDDTPPPPAKALTCPICSCSNASDSHICLACMNVFVSSAPTWKCTNGSCPPLYRNSTDVAFCGVCGGRRRS